MNARDTVLGILAHTERLGDDSQLAAVIAYCARLSSQRVTAELCKLERQGLVVMVRRTRQGVNWGLTPKGREVAEKIDLK